VQSIAAYCTRFFGIVQISSVGFLPLSIWTKKLGLGHCRVDFRLKSDLSAEVEPDLSWEEAAPMVIVNNLSGV